MMEASDLPNPVAGCRRNPGMRMLRRNAFGIRRGKNHGALDQKTYAWKLSKLPKYQTTRITGDYAHA